MTFRPSLKCFVATFLATLLIAEPLVCSAQAPIAPRSVAVQPMLDGDADEESREIASAVGSALRMATGHHIIDANTAAKVLSYRDPSEPLNGGVAEASAELARAKEHYFAFRYKDAEQELNKAIAALSQARGDAEAGQMLVDAYVTRAVVAKSRGDAAQARKSFEAALVIHPALALSAQEYPPSLVSLFEEVKKSRAGAPAGVLSVKSSPQAAEVFLNGISRGVTPLTISALPAGGYSLAVKADRYIPLERNVTVAAGKTLSLDEKLIWDKKGKERTGHANTDDPSIELRQGLQIADALKAEKVILIDADAKDSAVQVRARAVDRALRAGQRAVAIKKLAQDTRNEQLAEMVAALADQIDANITSDPAKQLDPLGEGDPVLLGKRKQPLTRKPLFWAAVGTAAVGAIVGGILAAMSGGDSTGSVRVNFTSAEVKR